MNGETWKPETSLRWNVTPSHLDASVVVRILEQVWVCVETGHVEWRPVPEVLVEPTSVKADI